MTTDSVLAYWRYYCSLERQLSDIEQYVEFDLHRNGKTYSLSTLAFAKGLMKLAEDEMLIVEVREWINKTSGRGDFIIKTVDHTGATRELFGKTILGFGCRPYEEVLPEVFPWADLELDTDYYEMHGDQEYISYKKYESPDIYPYRNTASEVDWYQFRPVLNDVGKAFLFMDDFLSNGRMYNIRF